MKAQKVDIPEESLINRIDFKYNYSDSYKIVLKDSDISVVDAGRDFFGYTPKWVKWLLYFRDRIVSVFGLKTSDKTDSVNSMDDSVFEPGDQAGLFKVYNRSENEIIMGEDDKHLDFRVSLLTDCEDKDLGTTVTLTTVVKYNNWFGKIYFFPVKPFHKIIVRMMLKRLL